MPTLTEIYNANVSQLRIQLNTIIRKINLMRIHSTLKKVLICRTINQINIILKKITKKYNQDMINARKQTAFLVGINYTGTINELYGCINDTKNIEGLLKNKYNFTNITLLNDETPEKPTKQNILKGLRELLSNTESGDTAFFMFSGHGTCTADFNNDEKDGQDEVIVPIDAYSYDTCIIDDELNRLIRDTLKPGAKLVALFDCCFSGTVLDLPYTYGYPDNTNQPETVGNVYMISGCTDQQLSMDTVAPINGKDMSSGAMTYAFLTMIKETTIMGDLVSKMNTFLNENGYTQRPLLSSGKLVDYGKTVFLHN
jgi:metacaspase-1